MNLLEFRAELESDLAWRLDELRHLRNRLLPARSPEAWPVSAMRTVLVMQYAHLEGYVRNASNIYIDFLNSANLRPDEIRVELIAAALAEEFEIVRKGGYAEAQEDSDDNGRLFKRARAHVAFVEKFSKMMLSPVEIDPSSAVALEMNLSADVLRRQLFMLGIPSERVDRSQYGALEFVRRTRNDIAHGDRKERIVPGEFSAYTRKSEQFMSDLARLMTAAAREEWYRKSLVPSVGFGDQ